MTKGKRATGNDPTSNSASRGNLYWRRPVIAWALYDWGNSVFATSVMVGFFPVFFNYRIDKS